MRSSAEWPDERAEEETQDQKTDSTTHPLAGDGRRGKEGGPPATGKKQFLGNTLVRIRVFKRQAYPLSWQVPDKKYWHGCQRNTLRKDRSLRITNFPESHRNNGYSDRGEPICKGGIRAVYERGSTWARGAGQIDGHQFL